MNRKNYNSAAKVRDFKGAIKRLFLELKGFKKIVFISIILATFGAVFSIITPKYLSKVVDVISSSFKINYDSINIIRSNVENSLSEDSIAYYCNNHTGSECLVLKDFLKTFDFTKLTDDVVNSLIKEVEIDDVKISGTTQLELINMMQDLDYKNDTKLKESLKELPVNIQKVLMPKVDMVKIRDLAMLLITMFILSTLFEYFEGILMAIASNNFARKLRTSVSYKINKLPLKYFDKNKIGDILSKITNDIDIMAQSLNSTLSTFARSITLFLGSLVMMFITNYIMALTAIASSLIGFSFMAFILSKSQKYFIMRQAKLGQINAHIEEIYSGLNIVKAYNAEKQVSSDFNDLNNGLFNANLKSQFLSGLMGPLMGFIGNLGYVAVCIVGALLAIKGSISFGVIIAFIIYVRLFSSPLSQIAQGFGGLQSVAAASERVFEILDEQELTNEDEKKKYLDKNKVTGKIEFVNVNFKYDDSQKDVIHNFSAIANPGEKIAIVGPTGAGKTTMVNLLMKFYEINSGSILIDGINICDLKRENIHDLFTMVLQDTWLFEGSIKDNIKYNMDNVTDQDVKKVCKLVGLDYFIKTLPKGYDTVICDGDQISSGQRQLITIARGMMKNAPFLILDEATSNVDTRTEELVSDAMDKLSKDKTSFIIAHRLSTIKNANLILVMNDGNIVEQGTHEELLLKNGFYAKLYNSQFSREDN